MARFDVYPSPDGGYWLDCQSDFLAAINSRFVVPLRPHAEIPGGDRRLNPIILVAGIDHVMQTHLAAAVSARLLRTPVMSAIAQEYEIGRAIDILTGRH